jgi:hypothetical protein
MQCARKVFVPSLVVVWAASCAVFPDEAQLPADSAAGAAGHDNEGQAGGAAVEGGGGGNVNGSGGVPSHEAGAPGEGGLGGAGGGSEPLAGAPPSSAGACAMARQIVQGAAADTWIEAAKPTMGHGDEASLLVTGDPDAERRALLSFVLAPAPEGATLVRGTVTLQLEANGDLGLTERHLELSQLEHPVSEPHSSWNKWDNGNAQWRSGGGDFGAAIASATIPALTMTAAVSFDVTASLEAAWSSTSVPFPLIVREVGGTPTPPAVLAFTSREGDALVPELLMEYCP